MAKKRQPGFDYPVPGRDELRPNMRSCNPADGPLAYAKPNQTVMDLGAPRGSLDDWIGVKSPASATFKAGVPMGINPSPKPEEQSAHIQTGITWPNRNKKDVPQK
jgi:hypothetical protein